MGWMHPSADPSTCPFALRPQSLIRLPLPPRDAGINTHSSRCMQRRASSVAVAKETQCVRERRRRSGSRYLPATVALSGVCAPPSTGRRRAASAVARPNTWLRNVRRGRFRARGRAGEQKCARGGEQQSNPSLGWRHLPRRPSLAHPPPLPCASVARRAAVTRAPRRWMRRVCAWVSTGEWAGGAGQAHPSIREGVDGSADTPSAEGWMDQRTERFRLRMHPSVVGWFCGWIRPWTDRRRRPRLVPFPNRSSKVDAQTGSDAPLR